MKKKAYTLEDVIKEIESKYTIAKNCENAFNTMEDYEKADKYYNEMRIYSYVLEVLGKVEK